MLPFPPPTVILSASEESRQKPIMNHMVLNTGRREEAAVWRSVQHRCHSDLQPRTPFAAPQRSPQGETRRYGIGFVSPVVHDEVPEPPSSGRGWRRQATEDRGVTGKRVQRVQKIQRVQRVVDSRFAAMSMKSALRDWFSFHNIHFPFCLFP